MIQQLTHRSNFFYFFYVKKNDEKEMMLQLPNLFPPISNSPISHLHQQTNFCPQLNLNHLPLGCQPCLLPLSHTLPSEKTTILLYKYQTCIILLATRKHQLYTRLKILEFFKTNYGMEAVTQPLSVISSQSLGSINYILGFVYYSSYI